MRSLSAAELLKIWEQGMASPPVEKALALLSAACPEQEPEALARLHTGRRDGLLMTLREQTFGPRLVSLATCPACGERLELDVGVADLRVAEEPSAGAPERLEVAVGDYEVSLRLPDSRDLAALAGGTDLPTLRQKLLERCLLAVRHRGEEEPAGALPVAVMEAAMARMAEADPQAEVELALTCPACRHSWLAAFDIVTFFWREIEAWAYRTLREIHTLAAAFGWREDEILALSPWRRQVYLQMESGG
jgi:hypothetical protein